METMEEGTNVVGQAKTSDIPRPGPRRWSKDKGVGPSLANVSLVCLPSEVTDALKNGMMAAGRGDLGVGLRNDASRIVRWRWCFQGERRRCVHFAAPTSLIYSSAEGRFDPSPSHAHVTAALLPCARHNVDITGTRSRTTSRLEILCCRSVGIPQSDP